ncbi:MAG: T9SS type A sorting domain-containing protein, partial [bacterium]|nr:T9SS type A sorting domain-containing protein [bacterium]
CPEQGTIFRITTAKPNTQVDVYTMTTAGMAPGVRASGTDADLNNVKAVPNPYYLFSEYDESTFNRALKFINLPTECTITIYNLAGDLVRTLDKNNDDTELKWDLLNEHSIPVGSGIYIYVVNSPDFGEKVGKMAVFTEVELLNQF